MEFLAPFHPQIIHTPIVLIVVGLLFEVIGRATDLAWWRKAAFAMLVLGVLGAGAAVLSGHEAAENAAEKQGVPADPIGEHEEMGELALWLGIGAVVTRIAASFTWKARGVAAVLALLLHVATAGAVSVAAYRGGKLVYEHAAAVRLNGQLIRSGTPYPHR